MTTEALTLIPQQDVLPVNPPVSPVSETELQVRSAALLYPYAQGHVGIPFEQIFRRAFSDSVRTDRITTGSGRTVEYVVGRNNLSVKDIKDHFHMLSAIHSSVAKFNIVTRKGSKFHPDFFAARFIRFSLEYFAALGMRPEYCLGDWVDGYSDDYFVFKKRQRQTGDPVIAAKETWTGQQYIRNGFDILGRTDIREGVTHSGAKIVNAYFRRPTFTPQRLFEI